MSLISGSSDFNFNFLLQQLNAILELYFTIKHTAKGQICKIKSYVSLIMQTTATYVYIPRILFFEQEGHFY